MASGNSFDISIAIAVAIPVLLDAASAASRASGAVVTIAVAMGAIAIARFAPWNVVIAKIDGGADGSFIGPTIARAETDCTGSWDYDIGL